MNIGAYQTAALAIYALKTYGPPAEKADTEKVIARGNGPCGVHRVLHLPSWT